MAKPAAVEGHRKDKLRHVTTTDIVIGVRFREDLGGPQFDALRDSILEKGIIQPITIDSNNNLLAGGRRMQAALQLGLPTIPAIIRDGTDELDAREIELLENTHRKDFTWAEQAKLVKEIDSLQRKKHGDNWSGRKTADLLDRGVATVARQLQLADALEALPELVNCKTADEALKVVKKLEDDAIVTELRRRQSDRMASPENKADPTVVNNQLDSGLRATLALADRNYMISDVFKGLSALKTNGDIQIIECDPPYGIDLNSVKGSKDSVTSTVHSYEEVDKADYPAFLDTLCSELFRVGAKDSWLVFWYGPTWHTEVLAALRKAGWLVDEIPAIWAKTQGQTLQPELYFARGYEPFFLCRKGKPVMVQRGRLNVFNYAGVSGKTKYHPTQRPVELVKEVLTTLGAGNQHVLVPFLGSGATLLACYDIGFRGFGFDLNGEYKDKFMLEVERQTRRLFDTEKQDDA
jgi:ParB/RepB/Spo0J family partition protein